MSVFAKDKFRKKLKQLTKAVINAKKQAKKEMAAKAGEEGAKIAKAAKEAGQKVCATCFPVLFAWDLPFLHSRGHNGLCTVHSGPSRGPLCGHSSGP